MLKTITTTESIRSLLNLEEPTELDTLILIGSSDSERTLEQLQTELRFNELKPTGFPTVFTGNRNGKRYAFGVTFATSLTADIVHSFCAVDVKKVALYGFCGSLSPKLNRGDVVSPKKIIDKTGINEVYGQEKEISVLPAQSNVDTKPVTVVTWHNLLSETSELIRQWQLQGIDVVDLESAAIAAVCRRFDVRFEVRLIVADDLIREENLQEVYKENYIDLSQKRVELIKQALNEAR